MTQTGMGLITDGKRNKYQRGVIADAYDAYADFIQKRKITPRDLEVLKGIYYHRCLTSTQIAKMYYSKKDDGTENKAALVIARRRLRTMYEAHLIDRFFIDVGENNGSSPQFCMLDSVGAYVVAGLLNIPLDDLKWRKDQNKVLLPYLSHTVGINDFWLSVSEAADRKKHRVTDYRVENHCRAQFMFYEDNVVLQPDAYFKYYVGSDGFHFFVEIDRGTMTMTQFSYKVKRYAKYYSSSAYLAEYPSFPAVMVVTTTDERARQIKKCIDENDPYSEITWLVTDEASARERFLERIWFIDHAEHKVSFLEI